MLLLYLKRQVEQDILFKKKYLIVALCKEETGMLKKYILNALTDGLKLIFKPKCVSSLNHAVFPFSNAYVAPTSCL